MTWVVLALLSAVSAAGTSLALKRAVAHGRVLGSTVAFRTVAGLLLLALTLAAGALPAPGPGYWRAVALVLPPEMAGMLCLSYALRTGELSHVQPLVGTMPIFVMLFGIVTLGEVPTPLAAAGILLVTAGVYAVGLRAGGSVLEPFRALARSRAGWLAMGASVTWALATVVHKQGIAAVGPFAWGTTIALGSGLALAIVMPFLPPDRSGGARASSGAPWAGAVLAAGACFAMQQVGLHLALRLAQAGYVIALSSTSTIVSTALGVLVLGERTDARARVTGALLVTTGAAVIALAG